MRVRLTAIILILPLLVYAQSGNNFAQNLSDQLTRYKNQLPQVKLFLFFNQRIYTPGDTAFFSARFRTEDREIIAVRQLMRVELVNAAGKIVQSDNIYVKDGFAANQIIISNQLESGVYSWVAYNSWMKNFAPAFYFKEDFLLVKDKEILPRLNQANGIEFSPEGNSFITGVSNRVVASGIANATVKILGDNQKNVAEFQTDEDGFGSFLITPQNNIQYVAEFKSGDKVVQQVLPRANADGISLQLNTDSSPAKIELRRPQNSKLSASRLWMIISARAEIYFAAPLLFADKSALTVQFDYEQLPTGICLATLFNEQGVVLNERVFMKRDKPVQVSVQVVSSPAKTRGKIELDVSLKDFSGNPLSGDFSISVINKKFSPELLPPTSIERYFNLNSDLKNSSGALPEKSLNNFLITQQNMRLPWSKIGKGEKTNYPFTQLMQYSGRIKRKSDNQPVSDSSRLLVFLQKNMIGYETYTSSNGEFDLPILLDFWGKEEMFFVVEDKLGIRQDAVVTWFADTLSPVKPELQVTQTDRPNSYQKFQLQRKLINQSYNFYSSDISSLTNEGIDLNSGFEKELSGADFAVRMDEYLVFPTMEDLVREVMPWVQHRKIRGRSQVRVILSDNVVANQDPLYIVDGVMTYNTDFFLQIKPLDLISVKTIRTYDKLMSIGAIARNGVVLVQTKGMFKEQLNKSQSTISVKGLTRKIPFPLLDSSKESRVPDFRSTLYWNPDIPIKDATRITFSASDDVGTFLIYIKGITTDGRPFEITDSIEVSFSKNQ